MQRKSIHPPVDVITGYTLCNYMLVLTPHAALCSDILKLKEEFATKYKLEQPQGKMPHIILARFSQLHLLEERLCNKLKAIGMAMPAFSVDINNFGSFPSHTVFLLVETKTNIHLLVRHIKTAQKLMKTSDQKPYFVDEPYIAIARKLLPWQYEQGWLEYSHLNFSARFIANSMQLLRQPTAHQPFEPIRHFEFLNTPVAAMQGALF